MTRVNFPAGFLWGTATAAHQVEGVQPQRPHYQCLVRPHFDREDQELVQLYGVRARQRLVDDLVERGVVAGRVDVPDFVVAGDGGLAQRFDLAERNLGESECAFVFVERLDHRSVPKIARGAARYPAAITKLSMLR